MNVAAAVIAYQLPHDHVNEIESADFRGCLLTELLDQSSGRQNWQKILNFHLLWQNPISKSNNQLLFELDVALRDLELPMRNASWACTWILLLLLSGTLPPSLAQDRRIGNKIGSDFYVTWSNRNVKSPDGGETIQLSLDYNSGSAIGTNKKYQFGYFSAQIKLVAGNSAGTLATFYLKTTDTSPVHDELDFEFLGNSSGQPYALQTNVFAANSFGREQRIFLWFDPTANFHTYSFLWNRHIIIFSVDSTPIRIFPNDNRLGVDYVYNPMKLYATIYNADDWVTRGGKVKIDWQNAPFTITLRDTRLQGCVVDEMTCSQSSSLGQWWDEPRFWSLSNAEMARLKYVQKRYMIYNYCTDSRRYPKAPAECINS